MNFILLITCLYSSIILFSRFQAGYDNLLMPAFKVYYTQSVKHNIAWWFRALFVSLIAFPFLYILAPYNLMDFVKFGALLGSLAFYFSSNFRLFLNKLRNARWDYISATSNFYDRTFTTIFGRNGGKAAYVTELILCELLLFIYLHG